MIRCDLGHGHDTLDAAVACVRVTKVESCGSTLPEARSPEPAPAAFASRPKQGRPRRYTDNAARQRAYRERQRRIQYRTAATKPHPRAMPQIAQPVTATPKATFGKVGLPDL